MSSQSIGVEIHPLGVRTARVSTTSKGVQVQQVGEAAFPEGKGLTSLRADRLPADIAALLEARQFRGRATVVIVDDPSAFLSTFDLAEGFTDELGASIKWYAEQYVPYPVDQAAVDFRVQDSPYGGHKGVQLIAIDVAVLAKVMELLPPKRIKVQRVDGVPHALSRLYALLVAATGPAPAPAVLVHACGASGYVVVTCGGVVETMRHVRLGVDAAVSLADKVRQTCQHYEVHHPTETVQAVYVTPATLARDGVQAGLGAGLGIEVKALDVTPHVVFGGGRDAAGAPEGWADRFALAIGAAC